MAQPIGGRLILGGGGDDEHRRRDDTRGDDDHTDVAQAGWTSNCERGCARFMLAVWAGRGAQAASCLVISSIRGDAGRVRFIFSVGQTKAANEPQLGGRSPVCSLTPIRLAPACIGHAAGTAAPRVQNVTQHASVARAGGI